MTDHQDGYTPARPTLVATALLSAWVAVLSLPMLAGRFLAGPYSDQYSTGFAFRHWAAEQWRSTGQVPLWNPEIFGGMPFVGGMHGDIFYPTAWLRLVLPTELAMNLGFAIHYVLVGLFMFLLLRALRVSWTGAVVGGFAYQLTGVVGSYVLPGHDGKLFVTAMAPLAMLALVRAMRDGRPAGYFVLALAVGLGVLSPHPQMLYYMLFACGLFALYLAFGREDRPPVRQAALQLGGALGAVVLGVGIGLVQILPFFAYIPFSPRAETFRGYEAATSFAIPWEHIPEFFFAHFTGNTNSGTIWSPNGFKLHSEYLGLPVVALAAFGAMDRGRRRLILWLAGIGALFLLVGMGSATPFYRAWYEVMPFMKQVRAPGMAFYLVALVVAAFAAFGTERIEQGEGRRPGLIMLWAGGAAVAVALAGLLGALAETLAQGAQMRTGIPLAQMAAESGGAIRRAGALSGVALAMLGAVIVLYRRGRLPVMAFALLTILVTSGDLFRNAKTFWVYSDAPDQLFAHDSITQHLEGAPRPLRVMDWPQRQLGVYPGATLMASGIPQLLGHHGNELHRFDELWGGQDRWNHLVSPALWDLYALQYVLLPAGVGQTDFGLPWFSERYRPLLTDVQASSGRRADLYVRTRELPYARLVPAAVPLPDEQAIQVIATGRLNPDRLMLLGDDADTVVPVLDTLPPPLDARVTVTHWEPGRMTLAIEPAAPQAAWLVVSENWYPDWRVAVDQVPTGVYRGNVSLIAVPVTRGARSVELAFRSDEYTKGKRLSLASLGVVALGLLMPLIRRKRSR